MKKTTQTAETGLLNILSWAFENYCKANFLKRIWTKVILKVLEQVNKESLSNEEITRLNELLDKMKETKVELYLASRHILQS